MTIEIKPVNLDGFPRPHGYSQFHKELGCYTTADARVIGVLIEDQIDHDYSWVVLANDGKMYRAIDVGSSLATVDEAIAVLHSKMTEWHGESDDELQAQLK